MPANLPITPEEVSLESELARRKLEIQIRPSPVGGNNAGEVYDIADLLEGDSYGEELLEELQREIKKVYNESLATDRFSLLHLTREAMTEVEENSELPDQLISDLTGRVAGYVDGFIPEQSIEPVNNPGFHYEEGRDEAATYLFREDRMKIISKFDAPKEGSSAAIECAHELMHKNNIEVLLGSPDMIREYAMIFRKDTPEAYTEIVEEMDVAGINEDLLGGTALFAMDQIYETEIMSLYVNGDRDQINFNNYFTQFHNAAIESQENHNLAEFDIRDETICQAVSFFMNGDFKEEFEETVEEKREYYNNSSGYSDSAGDQIAANLKTIKHRMEDSSELRGQAFKQTMQPRIEYITGEETSYPSTIRETV